MDTLGIADLDQFRVRRDLPVTGGAAFLRGDKVRRFNTFLPAGTLLLAVEPRPERHACWFVLQDSVLAARLLPNELTGRDDYIGYALAFSVDDVKRDLIPTGSSEERGPDS